MYRSLIAFLFALALCAAPSAGNAHPGWIEGAQNKQAAAAAVKACYGDCWHSRWRSHFRWGSNRERYRHDRWRSHFRWGSYGGYGHSRYWSHYRWGSYHWRWRQCDPCEWGY
ncbi:MAG: hypothetical protein ACLP1W_03150 [Rhodomicrobium sp.]